MITDFDSMSVRRREEREGEGREGKRGEGEGRGGEGGRGTGKVIRCYKVV